MRPIKQSRFDVLIILGICHFLLLLVLMRTHVQTQDQTSASHFMQMVFLKKTSPIKPEKIKTSPTQSTPNLAHIRVTKPVDPTIDSSQKVQDMTTANSSADTTKTASENDLPEPRFNLKIDIKAITQSMKEELNKNDIKPKKKAFQEFGEALEDASLVNHTGTKIVKRFAYDGRPVSKVITPFGTYCIRHPKAGEKLELTPPPLPVSCGRL